MIQDPLFEKTISYLSKVYRWSMYEEKTDFFRLKDILDSVSKSQWESKVWAVEELIKHVKGHHNMCIVIGGWYGLFSHLLTERGFCHRIKNIDLDEECKTIGYGLCIHDNIRFDIGDGLSYLYDKRWNNHTRIFVCTACEHIDQDDLYKALSQKDEDMLVCLQSNDYYDVASHINCKENIDEFVDSLPLKTILYKGVNPQPEYNRFMVIGK